MFGTVEDAAWSYAKSETDSLEFIRLIGTKCYLRPTG